MKQETSMFTRLRRYLLTGIVVIAPVGVTIFILRWILSRLDAILGVWFARIGVSIPGLGLIVLLVLVIVVGWIAQQAVGRQLIGAGRNWLMKFPLTKTIYSAASQITEQVIGEQKRLFKYCVLVEYPRAGCWAVGFLTNEAASEVNDVLSEAAVAVFIPTTPNPTSGFLAFLPRSQIRQLRMSVEDGFKLVISAGAVTPDLLKESAGRPLEQVEKAG